MYPSLSGLVRSSPLRTKKCCIARHFALIGLQCCVLFFPAKENPMNTIPANELLAAALIGYQAQLRAVDEKIHEIRSEISGSGAVAVVSDGATPAPTGKRSTMSAAAKARIAAAQRKRWAAYHKEQKPTAPVKKAKRIFSAAAKKRIADATKKRWAAYRAAKAKAA
jgi:hypothetical protein